jgi:glycosyltransferase involved in cell wall biosynthesis
MTAAGKEKPETASTMLFVDKVFLKRRKPEPLRGVELFNLFLVRDLVNLGYAVTLMAETSWKKDIEQQLSGSMPLCVWVPGTGIDALNGFLGALRLAGKRFDTLIVGNVGNGLIPAVSTLRRAGVFKRFVLVAHREAGARFVRLCRRLPGPILAVNRVIAEPFRDAGCPDVHVDYGVMNADRFHPASRPVQPGTPVRFCVLGMLDNAWKGADTAVQAFRDLPEEARESSELHLYAFTRPPEFPEKNIQAHDWVDPGVIPDLLRSMDVLLVPSRDEEIMRETFSQAVVQGMLTGLPVIVSNRPVLMEKVDEGGGIVYHRDKELVEAMMRLAQDAELRREMGARARSVALSRYVWDTSRFASTYIDR